MTTKIKPNLKVFLYKKSNECPINIHTYNSNVTHSMNEFLFFTKELLQVTRLQYTFNRTPPIY